MMASRAAGADGHGSLGSGHCRRMAAVLAVLAAGPSVAWGVVGADYLTDDFGVAYTLVQKGLLAGFWEFAFVAPGRPAMAPYHVLIYQGIGERFLLQALLLAVLNAGTALLLWQALRCVVRERTALLAALVFAVVPNRGATRLWFVLGANLLAVACLAGAVILLYRHARFAPAVVLLLTGIAAYEGIAGVGFLVITGWWLQARGPRRRRAVVAWASIAASALAAWAFSPKRDVNGPGPFDHVGTISSGVFGSGFWGSEAVGAVGLTVVLLALAASLAQLLPSFRRGSVVPREVLLGGAVVAAAVVPFLVGGAPFGVRGIFDRNNLVPDIGVSVIVGVLLAALWAVRREVGAVASVVVLAWLAIGNVQDVRDYRDAVRDGRALEAAVLADVDPTAGTVVVVPPLPGETGVEQYILDGDLPAALKLRVGQEWGSVSMPLLEEDCRARVAGSLDAGTPTFVYDRLARTVTEASGPEVCAAR